jgi:exportin-2 (importin alpha re-exporter)
LPAAIAPLYSSETQFSVFYRQNLTMIFLLQSEHITPIHAVDRDQIKNYLLNMMTMNLPVEVRKLVSAALQKISEHDFPAEWPNLLPEMVTRLKSPDFGVISNVMKALSPVFKGYRSKMATDNLMRELQKVLNEFAEPLTVIFKQSVAQLLANRNNLEVTVVLLEGIKTMLSIFYSLNSVDIPEYFEDNIQEWMSCFHELLVYQPGFAPGPVLADLKKDDAPGPLTRVWANVFHNIWLYNSKYDEQFENYAQQLLQDTWNLLTQALPEARFDLLVTRGVQFIASVAKSVNHGMFSNPQILTSICRSIVVPNVKFREDDEESFEMDPTEYVKADIEGVDVETRRRAVTELVRALRKFYEAPVTQILGEDITNLLNHYASNPTSNWRSKDQVIFLVIALAQRTQTKDKGVTSVNTLVPLFDFFNTQILPELQGNPNENPVVKADALKFVLAFRSQFSPEQLASLLPCFARMLSAESYVVVSYTCMNLHRIVPMLPADVLAQNAGALLNAMFSVIKTSEHSENRYVMRAILRVVRNSAASISPIARDILKALCDKISEIYKNPTDPYFLHYVFEAMSSTIGTLIKSDNTAAVEQAEADLAPMFAAVMTENIMELLPYVYQIMGLFIEARKKDPASLIKRYGDSFRQFLVPDVWKLSGNVPALTRLVRSYIKFAPDFVGPQLEPVLGVFQKLISNKSQDAFGIQILNDIVFHMNPQYWQNFYPTILGLLMTRLQNSKTLSFVTSLIFNLCLTSLKHGPSTLISSLDKLQPNLFAMLYKQVIIANVQAVPARDRKVVSLALSQLLFDFPPFLQAPFFENWLDTLSAIVILLSEGEDEKLAADYDRAEDDIFADGALTAAASEEGEFSNVFAQLATAAESDGDYFREVDAQKQFLQLLQNFSKQNPGAIGSQVDKMIPKNKQHLENLFLLNQISPPYFH